MSEEQLRSAIDHYEAARRRAERDAARVAEDTRVDLCARLLPVLDNLDRSIEHGADASPGIVEGMRLVRSQLESVLRDYGLERFDADGERFDPARHEAMDVIPVRNPTYDGVVVSQWRAGYRVGERVLRPAQVQVGRYR